MTMRQIISQEEIDQRHFLALSEEMSLREERLLHEETMICRHQQMEKEAFILCSPHRCKGKVDEGTGKGVFMTTMVKDLVNIEETAIRRETMRMRLGLCGAVLGGGGAGTRKGGDAAEEIATIDFETRAYCVQLLEK